MCNLAPGIVWNRWGESPGRTILPLNTGSGQEMMKKVRVRSGSDIGYVGWVVISGPNAYLASDSGIEILDIRDPVHPRRLGGHDTGFSSGSRASLAVSGQYLFRTGEDGSFVSYDVSDPTAPKRLGQYSGTLEGGGMGGPAPVVSGDRLLAMVPGSGIEVLDLSNPAAPIRAGFIAKKGIVGMTASGRHVYSVDDEGGVK